MILQKRKDTASLLRQAAEKANTLEEAQVTELKHQIKVVIESYIPMVYTRMYIPLWRPCKLKTLPTHISAQCHRRKNVLSLHPQFLLHS